MVGGEVAFGVILWEDEGFYWRRSLLEGKEHPKEGIEGIPALLGAQRGDLLLFGTKMKIMINTSHF